MIGMKRVRSLLWGGIPVRSQDLQRMMGYCYLGVLDVICEDVIIFLRWIVLGCSCNLWSLNFGSHCARISR